MDRRASPVGRQGFTLLEMGFVVGVVGIIILFTANLSSTQHRLQSGEHRADEVVQDVLNIIDAVWAWSVTKSSATNWSWPYDPSTTLIEIKQLEDDGYVRKVPTTRYLGRCEPLNTCNQWDYSIIGWDRDGTTATVKETNKHDDADDLIIKFRIAEERRIVDSIVARIPYGRIASTGTNNSGTPQAYTIYDIEARLFEDNSPITTSSQFVTAPAPTRQITFAEGDMQGIDWISRETLGYHANTPNSDPGQPVTLQSSKGGEALLVQDGKVKIGTINDKNEWTKMKTISGYMEVKSESNEATMGAKTILRPAVSPAIRTVTHETRIGVLDGVPIWETIGNQKNFVTTNDPDRTFRLEHKKGNTSWDMYFAKGIDDHKSLQCRLCRLERLLDTYKTDMSHDHTNLTPIDNLANNTYTDHSCSSFTSTYCGY